MDSVGGARIAVDQFGSVAVDSIEDQLRDIRRERDALRRENRVLKIAVAELERVSERDTLTPLFNRRYFLTAIHHRMARFERHAERAAVVFVDVNQLKLINDSFGHAAGDFALMEIAKRLAESIRATDVAARIGGDEFGLILDQSSEEGARAQIARLGDVLTAAPADYDGHQIALSACFGIAMLQSGMTESDILAAADRDMYRNKQGQGSAPGHR
ncbi:MULTISPECIES: GGDEF domain-containing protein [unclassified Sphingopyxis]|jgi:diguanylate cyclase (GGDEF)-like protein|uniref:GGDEF domain-containing protein n=1 Tax=unclassified Sphingopyxis TaxID=2614943 RepID=UPI0025F6E761|nr:MULTISPECIES: GGDEF domain-containing protein [unclassified Sphingopyxis]MBU0824271.1 GGDEF domain-containing protein [Alphaproteobacteria bacterium]MBU0866520.1 GGDEF domain-containing protein [Alphaproteobacteria bacterium]MBU1825127.1 GGDEF domain-containing protein [Alphaproteobacteria bacterium]